MATSKLQRSFAGLAASFALATQATSSLTSSADPSLGPDLSQALGSLVFPQESRESLLQALQDNLRLDNFDAATVIAIAERLGPAELEQLQTQLGNQLNRLSDAHRRGRLDTDALLFWEASAVLNGFDIKSLVDNLKNNPLELGDFIEETRNSTLRLIVIDRYRRETGRDPLVDFVSLAKVDVPLERIIERAYGLHTWGASKRLASLATDDLSPQEFNQTAFIAAVSVRSAALDLTAHKLSVDHILRNLASATEARIDQKLRTQHEAGEGGPHHALGDFVRFRSVMAKVTDVPGVLEIDEQHQGGMPDDIKLSVLLRKAQSTFPNERSSRL